MIFQGLCNLCNRVVLHRLGAPGRIAVRVQVPGSLLQHLQHHESVHSVEFWVASPRMGRVQEGTRRRQRVARVDGGKQRRADLNPAQAEAAAGSSASSATPRSPASASVARDGHAQVKAAPMSTRLAHTAAKSGGGGETTVRQATRQGLDTAEAVEAPRPNFLTSQLLNLPTATTRPAALGGPSQTS